MSKWTKILRPWFFGLGDQLQHTVTCRRFADEGYDVYISDKAQFRNPDIKKLVWDTNPFIKGFSSLEANCGDIGGQFQYVNHGLGFIQNWLVVHGIEPKGEKYPEIYYVPRIIEGLKDATLVDFSCVSLHAEYNAVADKLAKCVPEDALILSFHQQLNKSEDSCYRLEAPNMNSYYCYNIFDYADAIASCKKFMCLFSGGACLASALKKYRDFEIECFVTDNPKMQQAVKLDLYFFDNIKYTWI